MADDDQAAATEDQSIDAEAEAAKAQEQRDIIDVALKRYKRARAREKDNQDEAYEDLRFRAGDQWPEKTKLEREEEDRPCLTINKIPQFIRQVTGDMRQMRPALKAVPVDSRGDPKTAELISGMIRHVENRSMARHVYTTAADSQVGAGIGHWQVETEIAHESTFNQEIRITGIEDGIAVLWDPDAVLPTREDALFCFVPVDYSRDAFEERWPKAKSSNFGDSQQKFAEGWYGEDYVRVAAYWVKKPLKKLLALLPDGGIDDLTGEDEAKIEAMKADPRIRVEERDSFEVCRYLITCAEVLEGPVRWKGRYIPIVPVLGEEVRIGRKVVRHGLVRFARDPQRMVNYYASAETEVIALQPKAPWLATENQVKKHRDLWDTANTKAHPVLIYSPDKDAASPPSRVAPPVASQGISQGRAQSNDDLKGVIGIYDASLGARSNETSGKAIVARQREGDTGTFVYIDNFGLAIQHTGKIVLDLFPHIYDTERQQRIIGEDGRSSELVTINKRVLIGDEEKTLNDVTIGAYDVMLETGPSYTTKREEARDGMREFIQAAPEMVPVIGDMYVKAQDWPQAEEIGERLEMMLPAPLKAMLEAKKRGNGPDGKPLPAEPPQPDPAQLAQQQAEQQQQQAEAMKTAGELEKIKLENEGKKLDNERKQLELQTAQFNAAHNAGQTAQLQGGFDPNVLAQALAAALQPVVQRIDMLGEMVAGAVAPPDQQMPTEPMQPQGQPEIQPGPQGF